MEPKDYFPRPTGKPGVEPFEPPFTNAIKPEKKMAKRICGECGVEMGEVEAVGGDKTHGLCPKCAPKFWEPEKPSESGEKK